MSNLFVSVTLTCRPFLTAILNPCFVNSTLYEPGNRKATVYIPLSSETTSRFSPVDSLVAVTWAPATTAQFGSVTCPVSAPVLAVCAMAPRLNTKVTILRRMMHHAYFIGDYPPALQSSRRDLFSHQTRASRNVLQNNVLARTSRRLGEFESLNLF